MLDGGDAAGRPDHVTALHGLRGVQVGVDASGAEVPADLLFGDALGREDQDDRCIV